MMKLPSNNSFAENQSAATQCHQCGDVTSTCCHYVSLWGGLTHWPVAGRITKNQGILCPQLENAIPSSEPGSQSIL